MFKNNRLIYKCEECKEKWKRPLNKLIEIFQSTYQFCESDLNRFVLSLQKVFILMNIWIVGKNLIKLHYHLKRFL